MSCDALKGRLEPCKDSIGGLTAVYFMNFSDAPLSDMVYDVTNGDVIDTINITPSTVNAFKYELRGTSTFDENIVSSRDTGTTYVEQVLSLSLKKQDLHTHKEIKLLTYGRPKVVVEDNNGNFFLMGLEYGAEVTAGTIVSGAAMGDMSGYTLTLSAMEKIPANFMNATSEAGLATAGLLVVAGV